MAGLIEDIIAYLGATTTITGATSFRIHAYHIPQQSIIPHILVNRSSRDTPLTLDATAGLIRTDFARALWEDPKVYQHTVRTYPLRRIGEPDEVAGAAVFLASTSGSFVTGQTIVVDGGCVIGRG